MKDNLNARKFGLAGGILAAIYMAIITITGIFGFCVQCSNFLVAIYGPFGYSISWIGVIIGSVYLFIDTFIGLWLFAWIYNKL